MIQRNVVRRCIRTAPGAGNSIRRLVRDLQPCPRVGGARRRERDGLSGIPRFSYIAVLCHCCSQPRRCRHPAKVTDILIAVMSSDTRVTIARSALCLLRSAAPRHLRDNRPLTPLTTPHRARVLSRVGPDRAGCGGISFFTHLPPPSPSSRLSPSRGRVPPASGAAVGRPGEGVRPPFPSSARRRRHHDGSHGDARQHGGDRFWSISSAPAWPTTAIWWSLRR